MEERLHCYCGKVATGTVWVSSQDGSQIYECEPACESHSEFRSKHPHGYIPGFVSTSVEEVQDFLFKMGVVS